MKELQQFRPMYYRVCFTIIILLHAFHGYGQIDLKNSLNDLKAQFNTATDDKTRIRLAVAAGSFFLTNKEKYQMMADSAVKYAAIAESINSNINDKASADLIAILQTKILLRKEKFADVNEMISKASGALFCQLHALAGNYFLEKPGEYKEDLDIAENHFLAAQRYARSKGMPSIELINMVYRYNVMVERRLDEGVCDSFMKQVLKLCNLYGLPRLELKALQAKAIHELYHRNLVGSMYKAESVARAIRDVPMETFCEKEIADYYLRQGNLDSAEIKLNHVLKVYQSLGYKNLQFTYDLLVATAMVRGNLDKAMRYSLTLIKIAESTGTDIALNAFYSRLAKICKDLGLDRQSAIWYKKWRDAAVLKKANFPQQAYYELADELLAAGKPRQVLNMLDSAQRLFKHDEAISYFLPQLRANCYDALHKTDSAEFFNKMIISKMEGRGLKDYMYYSAYKRMAGFYISHGQVNKAAPFLKVVFDAGGAVVPAAEMAFLYFCQFKVDSARGDYLSALKNFKLSKNISDSINDAVKLEQAKRLQVQFATAERDRENLDLRNRNDLQTSELEKGGLHRKLITIALGAFILISGLMIYFYLAKLKTNRLLQKNQHEINTQNEQLKASQEEITVQNEQLKLHQEEINARNEQLKTKQEEISVQNSQLNQLLQEKEWLIKEIHHRVKNNLQIISSLLNTQASYLDSEQAVAAIRDSQNRMQAISIVHQRLYQSEDLTTISIQTYIKELSECILDSFHCSQRIKFRIDLADALLDTARTVPLGLILNEAITNCVKYAFDKTETGIITLSSSFTDDNFYELVIRDNGRGLPADFDMYACNSLGVNMIIGLTDQLGGRLSFATDRGTVITIAFSV
ncbi:tetratricopeptide repeat-containing sensor histidine kinase [Mucilaginibacter endophyticus]|uniref:tetratricopeptide repeat-containing sensor histidine kinase n=1 Tax=Mucilaginibacter endophyticus TaxID=2675003 RepID=UPI000E0DFA74|nr:sensor histidine kinase [Mucilaginibacter endophyticus]